MQLNQLVKVTMVFLSIRHNDSSKNIRSALFTKSPTRPYRVRAEKIVMFFCTQQESHHAFRMTGYIHPQQTAITKDVVDLIKRESFPLLLSIAQAYT